MNFFELVKYRRSIRKYEDTQIPREDLERIIEAGSFAPNAGGGQRSMIVAIRDRELSDKLGKLNVASLRRDHLIGGNVSADQPSIIDDPTIKSGFYGAPTVVVVFAQHNFLYSGRFLLCREYGLGCYRTGHCVVYHRTRRRNLL